MSCSTQLCQDTGQLWWCEGGRRMAEIVGGLPGAGIPLVNSWPITRRWPSELHQYHRMSSALGQLRTRSTVCLSPQSLQQLYRPSLFLHTARFALCGSVSCTAFKANFNSSGGSFCTTTLWFHWPRNTWVIWNPRRQRLLVSKPSDWKKTKYWPMVAIWYSFEGQWKEVFCKDLSWVHFFLAFCERPACEDQSVLSQRLCR